MKIRSFTISLLVSILFSMNMISCGATPVLPTQTSIPTITATSTPAAPTKTPTETPPQLPDEVKDKFDKAGIDLNQMQNATFDKDGLHITLESGEVVITKEQLEKNVSLGQPVEYNGSNQVLQIRDEANTKVLFAYDTNTGEFLDASKYIQSDVSDPEKYIQVSNWDELKAIWAKEGMFLVPFDPDNTYFPELDKIYKDYTNDGVYEGEFNSYYPFGIVPEGMDSPFKVVNFIEMQNDPLATDSYTLFPTEQVYNPKNKGFSSLHFGRGGTEAIGFVQNTVNEGQVLLPYFYFSERILGDPTYKPLINYLRENNLLDKDGQSIGVKDLVYEWLDTGSVPKRLEEIPLGFTGRYIVD